MLAIGCDHAGYELKQEIIRHLEEKGIACKDFGCYSEEAVDYPVYGKLVGHAVADGECEKGILICGTGIGISLAANKVPGIRAAVCSEPYSAEMTVRHNNAQIIAFGARVVGNELAKKILDAFFGATFEGGRHAERVQKICNIEAKYNK